MLENSIHFSKDITPESKSNSKIVKPDYDLKLEFSSYSKELEGIFEKVNDNNEGKLDHNKFVNIVNNILISLNEEYPSDIVKDIINLHFINVFSNLKENELELFNGEASIYFKGEIDYIVAEQLGQTAEQLGQTAEQSKQLPIQSKVEKEKVLSTENETAKTVDQTAKTVDQTAKTVDQTAKTVDQTKNNNIEKIKTITDYRKSIGANSDLDTEIIDSFNVPITEFNAFVNEFLTTDKDNHKKKELVDLLDSLGLNDDQKEDQKEDPKREYLKNLYVYGKILKYIDEKDRTDEHLKFIQMFESLSNDMGISVKVLSEVTLRSIPSVVSEFINSSDVEKSEPYRTKMSFNASSESVVHNNSVNNFINSGTPSLSDTVKENINEDLKGFQEYLKKNGKKWEDKYLSDDKLSLNMEEINNSTTLTQEEKNKAKEVNEKILDKQNKDKLQKSLIRERIIVNCFKYLSEYFANQGYNENMEINIEDGINFNESTMDLTITGSLNNKGDGKHVKIHYDLESGTIAMHDFFAKDADGRFFIGTGHDKKEVLNGVKMPEYRELEAEAKRVDYHKIMEKSKSVDEYKRMAKSTLNDELGKKFTDQNTNKFYIERFNEKNVAEQQMLENIFDVLGIKEDGIGTEKPNQYEMMRLLYDTLEHYDKSEEYNDKSEDFRNIQKNMDKLNVVIEQVKKDENNTKDPVIKRLFNENFIGKSGENWKNDGKSKEIDTTDDKKEFDHEINFLTFFKMFAIKKNATGANIIDISLFNNFMEYLDDDTKSIKDFKNQQFEENHSNASKNIEEEFENKFNEAYDNNSY